MIYVKNIKIKNKILLGNISFVLFFILIGELFFLKQKEIISSSINAELTNTNKTMMNMIRVSAKTSIRNYLKAVAEKNVNILQMLYEDMTSGKISPDKAKELSEKVLLSQKIGKTGYLYVIDSTGKIIIHPKKALIGTNLSQYDFIQEQKKLKEGYLEYMWKNPGEDQERAKALYMSYFDKWGWIVSVSTYREEFYTLINPEDFKNEVLNVKFGETGYTFVMDEKGNLIIHPKLTGNLYNSRDCQGKYFIREICTKKNGEIYYFWKNPDEKAERQKLAIYRFIPELKWIVISGSYSQEFYKPIKNFQNIFLFLTAILLIVMSLLNFYLNKTISKPINNLIRQVQNVTTLKHWIPIQINTTEEIGTLSTEFNKMIERINRYSEHLEHTLDEKTKNLLNADWELKEKSSELNKLQVQLIQQEKLASLGQLAAGVAHEINNPIGFIMSNINSFGEYVSSFKQFFLKYAELELCIRELDDKNTLKKLTEVQEMKLKSDIDFILKDIENLINESKEGSVRIKEIVQNLKSFARLDESQMKESDLNEGLEATLKILWNELKYKCEVTKNYGKLPMLYCYPGQLNQVFLNLLVNSAQAIPEHGKIHIETNSDDSHILIKISDTGTGITKENLKKIFDPFFTTKPVGKGTGLGLSISFGIIQKHDGTIEVESEPGKGTTFTIKLPVKRIV